MVLALLAALLATGVTSTAGHSMTAAPQAIYGTNMGLYDANEQLLRDSTARQILASWHTPVIQMPSRSSLSDSTEVQAMQTIKSIGAAPLVIVHGQVDANALADDEHLLALVNQVFGSSTVYVEYGNEEDLNGVSATAYTASWNAVMPTLKSMYPTYQFIGPVNYHADPTYIGYFVGHASPAPDVVSWHEYTCMPTDATSDCLARIAKWTEHVVNTNSAETAAAGRTFPFMITEWNMDPMNDSRYLDPSVIGPWTTQALQELTSLVPLGLIGAQQYVATSHGAGFELIDSNDNLTPQGQAFSASLTGTPAASPSPSPSSSSSPSPSPSPTATPSPTASPSPLASPSPSPSPTASPTPGPVSIGSPTIHYDFEDGTTQGWGPRWGAITVANSTTEAFSGTRSLAITPTGGYQAVAAKTAGLSSGVIVTYYVWVPQAVAVAPYATDNAWHNDFVATRALTPGWNAVAWTIPNMTVVTAIGLQVNLFTGTLYLDAATW